MLAIITERVARFRFEGVPPVKCSGAKIHITGVASTHGYEKTTRGNSDKVAQFNGKTADLATL